MIQGFSTHYSTKHCGLLKPIVKENPDTDEHDGEYKCHAENESIDSFDNEVSFEQTAQEKTQSSQQRQFKILVAVDDNNDAAIRKQTLIGKKRPVTYEVLTSHRACTHT